jgi:hypothetical protein
VALLGFVASIVTGVVLSGELHCPELQSIEKRLVDLIPASPGVSPDRATLAPSGTGISVELLRPDGSLIVRRVVPRQTSCDDTAETIAVTIASWESRVRTPVDLPLGFPTHPTPVAIAAPAPRASSLAWEVEVSFLGSIAGGSFAPGAAADVFLGRKRFPLGVRLGLAGMDGREVALGTGRAAWGRLALTISPTVEVVAKVIHVELHADVAAAWLFMQGRGFSSNYSDNVFDPALGGGIRASVERWSVTPWMDVTLLGWVLHQEASAEDAGRHVSAEIPRFDVWLRAGVAYGRRR